MSSPTSRGTSRPTSSSSLIVGDPTFEGPLDELDRRTGGELRALAGFKELTGKRYATTLAASGELPAGRLVLVAAGEAATIDREVIVRVGAAAERRLGGRVVRSLAFWLAPLAGLEAIDGDAAVAAELRRPRRRRGVVRPQVDLPRRHRSRRPPKLDELILVMPGGDVGAITAAAERGVIIGEGANYARTLSNRAANDVSPEVMAEEARAIAERNGLWIDVIEPERATELGMGMFMAVGRGSDNPPRMIVMRSGEEGQRDSLDRHVAIVGKGVCFDSGGISIKPSDRMEEMKMDKTGACTVLAVMETVARLAPGTPLLGIAAAVENMPGPHSTRPGDIVTALNGKKVDITNTDAEGRLILGDALTYAERLGATHLVDVATLTGAVARALGHLITGAFGQPQDWYDQVEGRGRPCRRALLATAADRRVHAGHGQLVRRLPERGLGRGLAREERPVPAGVRDQAVGPPRHRRDGVLPQGPAVRAARGDRRVARDARRARPGRSGLSAAAVGPTASDVEPLSLILGAAGAALGLAADRFATRWPQHDEEHPPGRRVDWRTVLCGVVGAVAFGLLPLRFGGDPLALAVFGAWFVTLIVGLATDLDQRLLPDELTLPVIPVALVYAVSGLNPLVGRGARCWPCWPPS